LTIAVERYVNDPALIGVTDKLAIELGPAFASDLLFDGSTDVVVGARPQCLCENLARPAAHSLTDVVTRDDEVLAVVGDAAQDHMDMRMFQWATPIQSSFVPRSRSMSLITSLAKPFRSPSSTASSGETMNRK
jgi:hypothetical protein